MTALLWIGLGLMIGGPLGCLATALCVMRRGDDLPEPTPVDLLQRVRNLQ